MRLYIALFSVCPMAILSVKVGRKDRFYMLSKGEFTLIIDEIG